MLSGLQTFATVAAAARQVPRRREIHSRCLKIQLRYPSYGRAAHSFGKIVPLRCADVTGAVRGTVLALLGRMIGTAKRGKDLNDGKEFTATQASVFLDGFTFRRFLEDCYSENRRRMGVFDKELLRPSFLPQLAETALGAMRLWSFLAKPLPA